MNAVPTTLPYFFLKPGDMAIADEPCIIATLLGSCVAVTMTSRRFGVGAVCHALLPSCKEKDRCDSCPERFRHVDCAIHGMIEAFRERGVPLGSIEAKLFGGSDMFRIAVKADGRNSVGRQNVDRARELLESKGINVVAADVGGVCGRKILFSTETGEVFLRRLNSIASRGRRSEKEA
jgi:chemotaxis protein CheD